jgi:hypothetical protein
MAQVENDLANSKINTKKSDLYQGDRNFLLIIYKGPS